MGINQLLSHRHDGPFANPVEPRLELGAYEAMWLEKSASFKKIADKFRSDPSLMPSDIVEPAKAYACAEQVFKKFAAAGIKRFGVRIHHAGEYPKKLREARNPVEMLYYRGIWEISELKSVSIVGSRKASEKGQKRASQIARDLVREGYAVASGLAEGIDQSAHRSAIENGGRTIAVIGTPLNEAYPKKHAELQEEIATKHLLISQIPVLRYEQQDWRINRSFFPERNATMSALTDATIIVEAGDTSGTLTQARAALFQGRKLFILNSCFERTDITWPARYEKQGAVRVRNMDDIWKNLERG